MKHSPPKKGFTLIEIMVVTVILGVIAAFALPNYSRTVEQGHLRDALMQLSAIRSANQIYFARTLQYWPTANGQGVNDINSALNLNIIENGVDYNCDAGATSQQFTCTATRTNGFTATVTEAILSNTNPRCTSNCP